MAGVVRSMHREQKLDRELFSMLATLLASDERCQLETTISPAAIQPVPRRLLGDKAPDGDREPEPNALGIVTEEI